MPNPLVQTLLCLVGLQAATPPPAPAGLLVIVTLGTPCLPAAYAQIRFPSLERRMVADSLGQATVSSVPEGDLEIVITHLGTAALSGTVRIVPGETQVVLADLHSRELRTVSIPVAHAGPRDRLAAKVHKTSARWMWTGGTNGRYGVFDTRRAS